MNVSGGNEQTLFCMAIIGVGRISKVAMIPAIRKSRSARLVVLGTSSPEKASRLSATYHVERCYASYEEALNDPSVEGAYIGLPNHLHKVWTLEALARGKHVLCDKPLAMNLQEAQQMNTTARSSGLVLMEGFMYRFHPQHALVRKLISSGNIGRVRLFEAHFHYFLEDLENIRLKSETGGGALYDVGCYGINSARYILDGEPIHCSGSWSIGSKSQVDEFTHFTLRFKEDRVAAITCGTHLEREHAYAVYGDLGVIRVPQAYVPGARKPTRVIVSTGKGEKEHRVEPANQYAEEVDAFVAACRGRSDRRIEGGMKNMAILDAVRRSCKSGRGEPLLR